MDGVTALGGDPGVAGEGAAQDVAAARIFQVTQQVEDNQGALATQADALLDVGTGEPAKNRAKLTVVLAYMDEQVQSGEWRELWDLQADDRNRFKKIYPDDDRLQILVNIAQSADGLAGVKDVLRDQRLEKFVPVAHEIMAVAQRPGDYDRRGWRRGLLQTCGDVESNPGPVVKKITIHKKRTREQIGNDIEAELGGKAIKIRKVVDGESNTVMDDTLEVGTYNVFYWEEETGAGAAAAVQVVRGSRYSAALNTVVVTNRFAPNHDHQFCWNVMVSGLVFNKIEYLTVIERLFQTGTKLVFRRPPRFGKTFFLSLIQLHYDEHRDARALRKKLNIPDPTQEFRILGFDLWSVRNAATDANMEGVIKRGIRQFAEAYDVEGDWWCYECPLQMLERLLETQKGHAILLTIDEYDWMAEWLLGGFDPNITYGAALLDLPNVYPAIARAVATGILKIHTKGAVSVSVRRWMDVTHDPQLDGAFGVRMEDMDNFITSVGGPTVSIADVRQKVLLPMNNWRFTSATGSLCTVTALEAVRKYVMYGKPPDGHAVLLNFSILEKIVQNNPCVRQVIEQYLLSDTGKAGLRMKVDFDELTDPVTVAGGNNVDAMKVLFGLGLCTLVQEDGQSYLTRRNDLVGACLSMRWHRAPALLLGSWEEKREAITKLYQGNPQPFLDVVSNVLRRRSHTFDRGDEEVVKTVFAALIVTLAEDYVPDALTEGETGTGRWDCRLRPRSTEMTEYIFEFKFLKRKHLRWNSQMPSLEFLDRDKNILGYNVTSQAYPHAQVKVARLLAGRREQRPITVREVCGVALDQAVGYARSLSEKPAGGIVCVSVVCLAFLRMTWQRHVCPNKAPGPTANIPKMTRQQLTSVKMYLKEDRVVEEASLPALTAACESINRHRHDPGHGLSREEGSLLKVLYPPLAPPAFQPSIVPSQLVTWSADDASSDGSSSSSSDTSSSSSSDTSSSSSSDELEADSAFL